MATHRYSITPVNPGAHLFETTVEIESPSGDGQVLSMPTWVPGSYMVRDYAKHVVAVRAEDEAGEAVTVSKLDKTTWQCAPCEGRLRVIAEIYAYDLSVRGAHLDATHAYFNGVCMFFLVDGQEDVPCELEIRRPVGEVVGNWRVVTSMRRKDAPEYGFGVYVTANYDELIDHPVEIGQLSIGEFDVHGIPHVIAIRGKIHADMGRLCRDLETLCARQHEFLGTPADMDRYVFLVTAVGDGYGGLEHRWSTSLICCRDDLPRRGEEKIETAYRKFLGLCSHEYFHSWNVKRMKPAAFTPYDLRGEVHTGLLWVFEGITSYYDDLMLIRSGLIDGKSYLELLSQTITRVLRSRGRFRQTVEESSFDAWTKFYKQDANSSNAIVSYYTKGSLISLALDLTIRLKTEGQFSLDSVMHECWSRFGETGEGMPERGLEPIVEEVTGLDLQDFFERYVRGTEEIPLTALLKEFAIDLNLRPAEGGQDSGGKPASAQGPRAWLGAVLENKNGNTFVKSVHSGSPAEIAGVAPDDEVVALDSLKLSAANYEKRLRRYREGDNVTIAVFRGDELLRLEATLAAPPKDTCYLREIQDASEERLERRRSWLTG